LLQLSVNLKTGGRRMTLDPNADKPSSGSVDTADSDMGDVLEDEVREDACS
jgi:hypothetical protein